MTERDQLIALCGRLGAAPAQATTMADQLLKRCDQLAAERGITRPAAMEYLLSLVVKGRAGETPAGFAGGPAPTLRERLEAAFVRAFGTAPTIITAAPGRIEVIGNHTDYNAGLVLGAAIDRRVWVALAPRADGIRRLLRAPEGGVVTLPAAEGPPSRQSGEASWTNYPLGVLAALPTFGLRGPGGFDYAVMSDLPTGAGLSSSAAIELASALAFLAASGEAVSTEVLVKIGRHAENHFVGVPCGILDQGVSGFGQADHLVSIDCRGPVFGVEPLPAAARFWVFNTHTKHALVDGLYAQRHGECMRAAQALGVAWLADATPAQVTAAEGRLHPGEFRRARHVVEEIARVRDAVGALRSGDLPALGRLLTASHRSSQHLFENSTPELDCLVDALTASPRVYGARLTGGGFGGAVMALTDESFGPADARAVADTYATRFGAAPEVLTLRTGHGAQREA